MEFGEGERGLFALQSALLQTTQTVEATLNANRVYADRLVATAAAQLRAVDYDAEFSPKQGVRCRLRDAGHILGAASLLLEVAGRRILFSGDLGRPDDVLMNPPEAPPQADTVLIESTYGNRNHQQAGDTETQLAAVDRKSVV